MCAAGRAGPSGCAEGSGSSLGVWVRGRAPVRAYGAMCVRADGDCGGSPPSWAGLWVEAAGRWEGAEHGHVP